MLDLINRYAHGFVAVPVILACREEGLFELLQQPMTSLELAHRLGANEGHLQVALRLLLSLNWLSRNESGQYTLTAKAASHRDLPADLLALYQLDISAYLMGHAPAGLLREWIDRSQHVSDPLLADFLDGVVVIPLLLALHQNKRLLLGERVLLEPLAGLVREELSDLFVSKGWAHRRENHLLLTEVGQFLVERALITGTTASYKPMLAALPELLFGDPSAVFSRDRSGHERHLDRSLNVVASGFQHEKYFSDVDEIIADIFNGTLAEPPNYVADMGCGDGTLLKRVYEVIRSKSARGRVLEQHPIIMIGVDYNEKALEATARTLSDIPHLVLRGDIGNPEQLLADLAARGIKPEEVLHIRSFLDHDRPFIPPEDSFALPRAKSPYNGVYVDASGASIPPYIMVQSLVEHLGRWATVVQKHGLIILEVHCLTPDVVAQFLDTCKNLHFDAYHAFSSQHLVDADVFLMAAAEVGLFPKPEFSKRYPRTFPFSRITLNWFEKRPYTVRHAQLEDLPALLNLEKACWPKRLQVSANEIKRRLESFPSGQVILEIDGKLVGAIYSQRIAGADVLEHTTFALVPSLQIRKGPVIQLLGMSVVPEMQDKRLGDQLLEFMLHYLAHLGGIRRVVGVTRCKNYAVNTRRVNRAPIPMAEYIQKRNEHGQLVDPILHFHEAHGATIKGIIHGYRPEDYDNHGQGVLIEYDLHRRQRDKSQFEPLNKGRREERALSEIVAEAVRDCLPPKRRSFFLPTRPLMEMGLDSLDLLELRTLLGQRFGEELEPTFFFRYRTAAAITRYFEERGTGKKKGPKSASQKVALDQLGASVPELVPALPVGKRYEPFPLTDIQHAYWIGRHGLLELGHVALHIYNEVDIYNCDLKRLEKAWQRLVERHDMLRAVILPTGEQQILEKVVPYQIEVLDLRGLDAEKQAAQLEAVREQFSHQILPADRPLYQIRAIRIDNQRTRIGISIDGLIVDLWSLRRIFQELGLLYLHYKRYYPPLNVSYRDYVFFERSLQDTELYRRSRDYWFSCLDTLPSAPKLPLAQTPKTLKQQRFTRRSATLELELWNQLKERAAKEDSTPSGLLLAAFAEILTVWSQSSQFTINVTLFNRLLPSPQLDDVIGTYTSLILLAVDNSGTDTFMARAKRLQESLWQGLEHRYISGVRVLQELARRQGGGPKAIMPVVFTSSLGLGSFGKGEYGLGEFGEVVYSLTQTPQVSLDHQVFEQDDGLLFHWDAVENLFPEGLLDDMFDAYCRYLRQLAISESAWVETTRQLVPPAQLSLQAAINKTAAPVSNQLLHSLFSEQVGIHADKVAVISPRRMLTYLELEEHSNQVAHYLRLLGAKPNTLVAIVMEKGWEQIVAVFGILKAGTAYTPIDANFPEKRVQLLIKDSETSVILTQSWLREKFAWSPNVQVICVDDEEVLRASTAPLPSTQQPNDLAYVLYTSGSTGKPKGVMIEHQNVVNRMTDVARRFCLKPADRAIALTALQHDLSVFDIFCMLSIVGGAIVLPEAELVREPAHWAQLMREHQVTLWNSVPAFMQMMVEYLENRRNRVPASLRWVILSGDFIPVSLPDRLRPLLPDIEIISAGGPTETTVWDICYPIDKVDPTWKSIPYGKPMVNAQYYVLHENGEPCPVWTAGELYIAGVGLARGYWRDEERTQASFMLHPQIGQRLYRSGDLGRYLPDGNIQILGRKDFQIKVRGYRIEAGEIEAVLNRHPAVSRAIVTATGKLHNKQLVAYVVTDKENSFASFSDDALKEGILDPVERVAFKLKKVGLRPSQSDERRIRLSKHELHDARLRAYTERQSYRQYVKEAIGFEDFSEFLSNLSALQLDGMALPKYLYGSAGGLYPVQTYLHIKPHRVEGIASGTYYYHPFDGELVLLTPSDKAGIDLSFHAANNRALFSEAAFSLFLVGKMSATSPMYGKLARDFCMLEAGYISQLLMMNAPKNDIGLCPIGDIKEKALLELLKLDPSHLLLHTLVGGGITSEQKKQIGPQENQVATPSLVEELRTYLHTQLPDYMVPARFVLLDELPLTANGKVDRQSLPRAERTAAPIKSVAPDNEIEQTLTELIQELLGVSQISVTRNLFELGATSLHLVQLYNKLQRRFDKALSVRDIFRHPTVRTLAHYLSPSEQAIKAPQQRRERGEARRLTRRQSRRRSKRSKGATRGQE